MQQSRETSRPTSSSPWPRADIDARHRATKGADANLTRLHGVAKQVRQLSHALDLDLDLDHWKAEALLERLMELRFDIGADADADLVAPLVCSRWLAHPTAKQ